MYHDLHFRAMNTDVNAYLWHEDTYLARAALHHVEQFFHEAHTRFTRFEASSELSALNAAAGQAFRASPQMIEVVELALKFSDKTGGLFNPTIIGALEAAGYDRTFDAIAAGSIKRSQPRAPISPTSAIVLDRNRQTITLPKDVRLDLGGIVKGWAVQRATEQLAAYGPCLVDAGGDIMTLGVVPGTADWSIEIAEPFDRDQTVTTLNIRDRAVATSGSDRRRWQHNGAWQHHLIDPRTGQPSSSDLLTATVIAPTTVEAEVYAKTLFLLGSVDGLSWIDEQPMLAACVITTDGEAFLSNRMREYQHVIFTFASTSVA